MQSNTRQPHTQHGLLSAQAELRRGSQSPALGWAHQRAAHEPPAQLHTAPDAAHSSGTGTGNTLCHDDHDRCGGQRACTGTPARQSPVASTTTQLLKHDILNTAVSNRLRQTCWRTPTLHQKHHLGCTPSRCHSRRCNTQRCCWLCCCWKSSHSHPSWPVC